MLENQFWITTKDDNISYQLNEVENGEYEGIIKEGGRKMRFLVKPAKNPNTSRALIILHGHGANKKYARYNSEDWTVICPIDDFGTDGLGSWWLGEGGDFFMFRLLQALIKQLFEIYRWSGLYFWGSS